MRLGFFGGTFDPPHQAHLRIATAAADRLRLDQVLFVPVALQPLKRDAAAPADYSQRLAMLSLQLAAASDPRFGVSTLDAPQQDGRPNYSYTTLLRLRSELAPGDQLFVLLGADSFLSLPQWHRAGELLPLASWVVASRPGFDLDQLGAALSPLLAPGVAPARRDCQPGCYHYPLELASGARTELYVLPDQREDLSATGVRADLATGNAALVEQALAPPVLAYIRAHGLYAEAERPG
ncbi:MAG TPA: nicotinate (nicotinamide) nucleotide adenylyltransferase [Acidobacteriaceae bacterium]